MDTTTLSVDIKQAKGKIIGRIADLKMISIPHNMNDLHVEHAPLPRRGGCVRGLRHQAGHVALGVDLAAGGEGRDLLAEGGALEGQGAGGEGGGAGGGHDAMLRPNP